MPSPSRRTGRAARLKDNAKAVPNAGAVSRPKRKTGKDADRAEKCPQEARTVACRPFAAFCPGKPEAQGGTVPLTRNGITRQVTRGSKGLPKWRKAMTAEFTAAAGRIGIADPLDGALATELTFIVPRLSSHPKTKDGLRWPITYRDADKLERAVNDSLTKAGVITDDNRICVTRRVKRYATLQETPGVIVRVWQLGAAELEETNTDAARAAEREG